MTDRQTVDGVIARVAALFHRLHADGGVAYGSSTAAPTTDAWVHLAARTQDVLGAFADSGGPPALAADTARLVRDSRDAVASCPGPVFCHGDVTGGKPS